MLLPKRTRAGIMILFRMKEQFLLTPTIGFIKEGSQIRLCLSWIVWAISFPILYFNDEDTDGNEIL